MKGKVSRNKWLIQNVSMATENDWTDFTQEDMNEQMNELKFLNNSLIK